MYSGITFISLSLLLVHILSWHYEGSFFLRNAYDHLLVYDLFSMSGRGWASSNQGSKCYHDKRMGEGKEYINLPLDPGPL